MSNFSPIVVDGVVYVGTNAGTILAIGGSGSTAAAATALAAATPTSGTASTGGPPAFAWATRGGDQAKLVEPLAVAVAPDGKIWVADVPGRFLIFDAGGYYLETWGSPGTEPGQFTFDGEYTVAFFAFAPDGSFYVSDINNQRVQHFDKERNYLGEWGLPAGTGDGQLQAPGGIVVLADGTVLVSDDQRNDIQHFDANGTFLDRFDAAGTTDGPLNTPVGIAVDQQGRLIVAEIALGRVRVFDRDGNQVGTLDVSGQQPPFLSNAGFVAVDADSNISICDQNNGLIRVFGPDLQFKYQWGNTGEGDARLTLPGWMAFGPGGAVYVTDATGLLRRFNLPR